MVCRSTSDCFRIASRRSARNSGRPSSLPYRRGADDRSCRPTSTSIAPGVMNSSYSSQIQKKKEGEEGKRFTVAKQSIKYLLEVVVEPRFLHRKRTRELLQELLFHPHIPVLIGLGRRAEHEVEVVDYQAAIRLLQRNLITVSKRIPRKKKTRRMTARTFSFFIISRSCSRMLTFRRRASISTRSMY